MTRLGHKIQTMIAMYSNGESCRRLQWHCRWKEQINQFWATDCLKVRPWQGTTWLVKSHKIHKDLKKQKASGSQHKIHCPIQNPMNPES
jgi:hypothetical protein